MKCSPEYIGQLVQLVVMDDDPDWNVPILKDDESWIDKIDFHRSYDNGIFWVYPGTIGVIVDTTHNAFPNICLPFYKVMLPKCPTGAWNIAFTQLEYVPAGFYWVHSNALMLVEEDA